MAKEYRIGALWIGGALSFLEHLCLKSFTDAGHHVTLFTYGEVAHVPQSVEIADANTILKDEKTIRHTRTGSPAPQADRFRYHMLAQLDDIIWADTDAYCVRQFTTNTGHFYGWESPHHVNNGVLGLPHDSETLRELLEFTSDEFAIPEWLPASELNALHAAKAAGNPVGVGDQQWGAWGPRALTHFLHKTGEIKYALPREALYPIGFKDRGLMVRADAMAETFVTQETRSIHFYGRRMRERIINEGGTPADSSLIGRLLRKHHVNPADYPLPAPPKKPQRLTPEQRHGRGELNLSDLADHAGSDRGATRHGYMSLYQLLFLPYRQRKIKLVLLGVDGANREPGEEPWTELAKATLQVWLDFFPRAEILAIDTATEPPLHHKRLTYKSVMYDNLQSIENAVDFQPNLIMDDATHASHHQQNAIRALFPKLAAGGIYTVEDLRSQPAPLEKQDAVKTATLFNGYLETGVFEHPDDGVKDDLNRLRADISGCFVHQARFQKHRRDQILVLHKR